MKKFNGKLWVSELSNEATEIITRKYLEIVEEIGYSLEEKMQLVCDLANEKLVNITDTFGDKFIEELCFMN